VKNVKQQHSIRPDTEALLDHVPNFAHDVRTTCCPELRPFDHRGIDIEGIERSFDDIGNWDREGTITAAKLCNIV